MSFKEVKDLRKSGKLDEALEMANQDLEKEPNDIWNKRSLAWVYYDYLKEYASKKKIETFIEYLIKIKSLELPTDEKMVYDACAFQIGKIIFTLANKEHIDNKNIHHIFEHIKVFHFSKPSEAYSYLYKAFHKFYKSYVDYIQFADWWGFDNFRPEDFLSDEFNGNKMMSIVEQAYIIYSKKLLEKNQFDIDGYLLHLPIDKLKIKEFLPKLDQIIESHPEYQYLPYFKAKLLLALGDDGKVLSNFLPFAKKKRNDFWVWELLADTFKVEDERKMACLCKALSMKTPNEFLINTRQKLTELLIRKNKYREAKTEIEMILSARNDNNWRIPNQLMEWTKQDWYKNTHSQKNNTSFYNQHVIIAEEILFADIPEEIVVVEFVNENKSILNFIKDKSKQGFFNYSGMIQNPKIGDLISVRFRGAGQNGFYKAISIKKVTNSADCDAIKEFHGNLKTAVNASFGFVDDVFIDSRLIVKNELSRNDKVKGKAVLSFNKKKNEWGWKAYSIVKI